MNGTDVAVFTLEVGLMFAISCGVLIFAWLVFDED